MTAPHKIRFFRVIDNKRVAFTMELDQRLTLIREYPDEQQPKQPSQETTLLLSKWYSASSENPIPGSEDIRAAYFEAHAELQEKLGLKCKSCDVTRLQKKFRKKLEDAGWLPK